MTMEEASNSVRESEKLNGGLKMEINGDTSEI